MDKDQNKLDAIIIGAGFSGLYQLHALRDQLDLNVTVFEAGSDLGGTWFWNRYPGARCDSESHSYCYMFSEEIYKEWSWSERYPGPTEIRSYLEFVAHKLDLRKDIVFNTVVTHAHFIEESEEWEVTTNDGNIQRAQFLITAIGCISTANIPDIPGLESFEGEWYHTGNWPKDDVSFDNKRVGQIGTGSTGIQAAPVIAKNAQQLVVFQRTANYSVPARNAPLSKEFKQYVHENFEEIKETVQSTPNGHPFRISTTKVFEETEAQRKARYEAAWEKGGLQFRATYQDLVTNKKANDTAANFLKNKIKAIINDPETAESLSNIDHPYAGKRPPIDTDYFETFNRDNVRLIDLKKHPISRITRQGIEIEGEQIPLDVIVFATGFDAMTGKFFEIDIIGRDNVTLKEAWAEGPSTFLGLQTPGFPNLFSVTGPGSPSVLCNMPVAIEQHVEWITECISFMMNNNVKTCEADHDAARHWGNHVNDTANQTLLPTVKHSWYLGANIKGKPRVFMPYAGGMARYREICEDIAKERYPGFKMMTKDMKRIDGRPKLANVVANQSNKSPGV